MRSPPRKPTASGSSKSSFHSKTPDGAGTSPAPPFSFPAPQQKAGIPGEAKEDILSVPAGGSSHYGARGRSLWRKAPSPLDPHPKHGGRHLTPSRRYDSRPEWAANRAISSKAPRFIRPRRRFGAFPFGNPSEDEGERQRGEEQRVSSLRPNECHARKCGDALRSFGYFQRSRQKTPDFCRQFVPAAPSYG